jgi:hypothetical protein
LLTCLLTHPLTTPGYLSDRSEWSQYDATELLGNLGELARGAFDDILVDVGTADSFLTGGQLLPEVSMMTARGQLRLLSSAHDWASCTLSHHAAVLLSRFCAAYVAFRAVFGGAWLATALKLWRAHLERWPSSFLFLNKHSWFVYLITGAEGCGGEGWSETHSPISGTFSQMCGVCASLTASC